MSVVKINAISIPEGMGPELETRFAARAHAVDNQPGFERFQPGNAELIGAALDHAVHVFLDHRLQRIHIADTAQFAPQQPAHQRPHQSRCAGSQLRQPQLGQIFQKLVVLQQPRKHRPHLGIVIGANIGKLIGHCWLSLVRGIGANLTGSPQFRHAKAMRFPLDAYALPPYYARLP